MRARLSLVMVAASTGLAILIWACGSFTDGETPPDVDSGTQPDGPIASVDGQADEGGTIDAGGDATTGIGKLEPPCPRPPAPTCAPLDQCENRILYNPPALGVEFPFGIATDSDYVYWVTSSFDEAGDLPYDGMGTAKIMRVDRKGAVAGGRSTVIAAGQRRAVAITMAGDYVYWAAMAGVQAKLRRVRRDCPENCLVEDLTAVALGGAPIIELATINDQTIVLADGDGKITVVKTSPTLTLANGSTQTSDYPALAATSEECFVAGALIPAVTRIPGGTMSTALKFGSTPDAGPSLNVGLSPMTTDCKDIYGWRGGDSIWKLGGDGGTATEFKTNVGIGDTFDMAADQGYLYLAVPDGPGLFAVSISGGQPQQVIAGNVHRLAVDGQGIYYGDHDKTTGGAVRMIVR